MQFFFAAKLLLLVCITSGFFMQARKTNLKGKNISDNQAGFIAHIRLREMAVFATPLSFIFRGWVSSCKRVITTNDLTQF